MNFYLIYGNDKSYINNKIDDIKQKNNININNIIRYNFNINTTYEILEEASMISMFLGNKLIIVETTLNEDNIDVVEIEKYMKNFNKNTFIIFYIDSDKVDTRKKIYKLFTNYGKVISAINNHDNTYDFVKKYVTNNLYKITDSNINYLLSKTNNNIDNIKNELDKLFIYKLDDKKITKEDIDDMVIENIEEEIFSITNATVSGDVTKALELYNKFMDKNYEPTQIISLLANQFQFLYQVKYLYNQNKYQDEIANILKVHPYRVKLAINSIYYYTSDDLLGYILRLANLDREIKLGNINKNTGLELFLINKDFNVV